MSAPVMMTLSARRKPVPLRLNAEHVSLASATYRSRKAFGAAAEHLRLARQARDRRALRTVRGCVSSARYAVRLGRAWRIVAQAKRAAEARS